MTRKRFFPITYKFAAIFLVVIISLSSTSVITFNALNSIEDAYNTVTDNIYHINDLINFNNEIFLKIDNFIESKDRNYIDRIYIVIQDFQSKIRELEKTKLDIKSQVVLKNISNSFENAYIKDIDKLIYRMRAGDNEGVLNYYQEVEKNWKYTNEFLKEMLDHQIIESQIINNNIKLESSKFVLLNKITISIIVLWIGLFIYFMGAPIIKSISKLSKTAEKVSEGNFDIDEIRVESYDEIGVLTIAFNKLIFNTKTLIDQIKTNASLEIELHKNEADKNKIKALLNESELMALQSQINPHFLFNTLNIIAKTAIIEDAEETCSLIETVSDMLRYNLSKLGDAVTLQEEIESIKNYFIIQKSRFSDRFAYEVYLEDCLKEFKIPLLTLQPIIENAFIHGIEPLERGGMISVDCVLEEDVIITVSDNGVGMSKEKSLLLLSDENIHSGHTTGIGIANVRKRLMLYFDERCKMNIYSEIGEGTTFEIIIDKSFYEDNLKG